MKRVLFICTGNTCRSPMAEALLRDKMGEAIEVKSAGLHASTMSALSEGTRTVLEEKGIFVAHSVQELTEDLIDWADLLLTMTESHKQSIQVFFPEVKEKLFTLKEFAYDQEEDSDIADPFGGSLEQYRTVAEEIEGCLEPLIEKLNKK
ncbi:low molecular weight protein arginine phosphatase [Halalkalibacter hemicellulosilyticus]|uniref:Low molecular weight protein tyrosine phosphatase n=1 Tax=Halalkalibacter hemicellulosilyticusJCM 9152 TaxID=1236971 RepID=W4QGT3_9BACI|nr:low molecular weight protein arginine phosphatase [Halalkalibacter hemicellulosilyticus]GAE31296.1 low molecular weight protein tyrosine phosphatase [Halalkalibacter hemicellulosilyticusJCM 9152]